MKPNYYFNILCFLLVFSCVFAFIVKANSSKSKEIQLLNPNGVSLEPVGSPTGRSLLSIDQNREQDKILVAGEDGMVYYVERKSGEILWSFSTGSSLYSSYQALTGDGSGEENTIGLDGRTKSHLNHSYLDVRYDWKLVWKGPNITAKMERPMTLEEFLSKTPCIVDGQVILSSKNTTVFVLDAATGRMLYKHTSDNSHPNVVVEDTGGSGNLIESTALDLKLIYIARVDTLLQSSSISKPDGVVWDLKIGVISNAFPGFENHVPRGLEPKISEPGLEYEDDPRMLMPYQEGAQILGGGVIPNPGERALPGPNSNANIPNEYTNRNYNKWLIGSLVLVAIVWICRLWQSKGSREKKTVVSKRKKARRLGNNKNNVNSEKSNKLTFSEEKEKSKDLQLIEKNDDEQFLDLTKPINGGSAGRKIGKLFVSNIEIAKGSNGTVVLEGNYEGRPVAIKRLVKAHHDVAYKEIQNLIASDQHPNIVRWYGAECDADFVYLSLERCMCSLNDLIQVCSESSQSSVSVENQSANSINEYKIRLDSVQGIDKDIKLWKANGYPSPQLLEMMRDVVSGLAHLHELGIIHRDLKPQNVLILKQRSLCAKLSDMGISKRLVGDMSSLGHHATGSGSSGWQAPEQLLHGRQTRSVDIFSLGCVLFFCITGGKHPFGDRLERDINIVKNRVDLFMVEHIPEAVDLLSHLLHSDPELRPKALDVLHHPLFWDSQTRLSFLRDTSDRVELEDRENESALLEALEAVAPVALGGKWDEKMEAAFIANIGRYRRYKYDSTRDLLRVIRNKLNHYRELPKDIQEILGAVPEGFDGYFAIRFPRFLIEVYKVMYQYCREEECFSKYFKSNLN